TYLAGYPLKDLVIQKSFIESYSKHLEEINLWLKNLPSAEWRALVGGLDYELYDDGELHHVRNVIFELIPGTGLKMIYSKRLLPNYDIFDEQKYFTKGEGNAFYTYGDKVFG